MTEKNESPEQIEKNIEKTRSGIHHTLNTLEEKLSPGQLMDQAIQYIRNGAGKEAISKISHSVQRHPVPVALTCAGVGWFLIANRTDNRRSSQNEKTETQNPESISSKKDTPIARGWEDKNSLSRSDGGLSRHKDEWQASAREKADTLKERTNDYLDQVREKGKDVVYKTNRFVNENPIVAGALGFASGVAIATLVPTTSWDRKIFDKSEKANTGKKSMPDTMRDTTREAYKREGGQGESYGKGSSADEMEEEEPATIDEDRLGTATAAQPQGGVTSSYELNKRNASDKSDYDSSSDKRNQRAGRRKAANQKPAKLTDDPSVSSGSSRSFSPSSSQTGKKYRK